MSREVLWPFIANWILCYITVMDNQCPLFQATKTMGNDADGIMTRSARLHLWTANEYRGFNESWLWRSKSGSSVIKNPNPFPTPEEL